MSVNADRRPEAWPLSVRPDFPREDRTTRAMIAEIGRRFERSLPESARDWTTDACWYPIPVQ